MIHVGDLFEGHLMVADLERSMAFFGTALGLELAYVLRARGIDTPILLLTGRHAVADRIRGLDVGADDYLGKPFAFEELLARLRAITRRGRSRQLAAVLSIGPLQLDPDTRQVTVDKAPVLLTDTEFRLLRYLLL